MMMLVMMTRRMMCLIRQVVVLTALVLTVSLSPPPVDGLLFVHSPSFFRVITSSRRHAIQTTRHQPAPMIHKSSSSSSSSQPLRALEQPDSSCNDDDILVDDDALLRTVTKAQLTDLCQTLQLSTKGSKRDLLLRLRQHAERRAEEERQIVMERERRVEEGTDNAKERYEIVGDSEDDDDDDDAFFYFQLPDTNATSQSRPQNQETKPKAQPSSPYIPNSVVTAPPPPKEPNQDGERVVTIYDSAQQNDLTGIAAAQPGQAALGNDNLMNAGASGPAANQPWDLQNKQPSSTSLAQLEKARATVTELVTLLLAMTGAPAFLSLVDGDDTMEHSPYYTPPDGFVGFDPSTVPTELLTASSQALRTGRGQVLQDVMRQFELQGIGQDGRAGDNVEKGGGHYREASKVHAFLDGYRRAEVRRLARETSAMLLDMLVQEGVEGLDMTLASMSRSSDDTAMYAGELNDSLLDYLNEAIRQQEKKVDQFIAARLDQEERLLDTATLDDNVDPVELLWNVTQDEDGQRMESIDPNDPKVHSILQREDQKTELLSHGKTTSIPESASEKLLLLLTLLRERIKAEAAFAPDEKGRNLRLLAYCLRLESDQEREQMILKDVGNSLERLDSFLELVSSSIEYGESTSYQLQPAKTIFLNVKQLKNVKDLVEHLRERQSLKASGAYA